MKRFFARILLLLALTFPFGQAQADIGPVQVAVVAPFSLYNGIAHFGASAYGTLKIDMVPGLSAGLESGFYIGTGTYMTWYIPVLATAFYDFKLPDFPVKPFAGLGTGIAISGDSVFSEAVFHAVVHAGVRFGSDDEYLAEIKLGMIDEFFMFSPVVGIRF